MPRMAEHHRSHDRRVPLHLAPRIFLDVDRASKYERLSEIYDLRDRVDAMRLGWVPASLGYHPDGTYVPKGADVAALEDRIWTLSSGFRINGWSPALCSLPELRIAARQARHALAVELLDRIANDDLTITGIRKVDPVGRRAEISGERFVFSSVRIAFPADEISLDEVVYIACEVCGTPACDRELLDDESLRTAFAPRSTPRLKEFVWDELQKCDEGIRYHLSGWVEALKKSRRSPPREKHLKEIIDYLMKRACAQNLDINGGSLRTVLTEMRKEPGFERLTGAVFRK